MSDQPSLTSRPIRSFVIRNGRLTDAQRKALSDQMPVFGLPFEPRHIDFHAVFGNENPVWLEIGFGNGEALLEIARAHPQTNFVGIEVHAPGVGHLLAGIAEQQLNNIRVIRHDAVEVLQHMIQPGSLARVLLFFPDPWHKKRHHKRRILQTEFVELVEQALCPGGTLHCATDWTEYAESMLEVLAGSELLVNQSDQGYCERPPYRPQTKFELRGLKLGHQVHDLLFQKKP